MWEKMRELLNDHWFALLMGLVDLGLTVAVVLALYLNNRAREAALEAQRVLLQSNTKMFGEAQAALNQVREQVIRLEGLNSELDKNLANYQASYGIEQARVTRQGGQVDELLGRIDALVAAAAVPPSVKMEPDPEPKRPPYKRARNNVNFNTPVSLPKTTPAPPAPVVTPNPIPKPKSTPTPLIMNSGEAMRNADLTQPFKNNGRKMLDQ